MKIIIDSNILISALIHSSAKRMIIMLSGLEFCYPRSSQREINKYKQEILEKSGIDESEYQKTLDLLFDKINLVEEEEIQSHLDEAKDLIGKVDPKDIPFIACALAHPGSAIWSDDKHLDKQSRIRVLKQKDILELIER